MMIGPLPRSDALRVARLMELADHLDRYVADRPELVTSQVGFAAGIIVAAIKSNPIEALGQLESIGTLLGEALAWVDHGTAPANELLVGLGRAPG